LAKTNLALVRAKNQLWELAPLEIRTHNTQQHTNPARNWTRDEGIRLNPGRGDTWQGRTETQNHEARPKKLLRAGFAHEIKTAEENQSRATPLRPNQARIGSYQLKEKREQVPTQVVAESVGNNVYRI
jgi:hypothetical protein